jgi:hypothetical protein
MDICQAGFLSYFAGNFPSFKTKAATTAKTAAAALGFNDKLRSRTAACGCQSICALSSKLTNTRFRFIISLYVINYDRRFSAEILKEKGLCKL